MWCYRVLGADSGKEIVRFVAGRFTGALILFFGYVGMSSIAEGDGTDQSAKGVC